MKGREIPTEADAGKAVRSHLGLEPRGIRRFKTGLCHFVFEVETSVGRKVVVRIATAGTQRLLEGGVYWNHRLRPMGIPLPRMLATAVKSSEGQFPLVIMERLAGSDLGDIYRTLSAPEKLEIVSEVVKIQEKVSALPEAGGFGFACSYAETPGFSHWAEAIFAILDRARQRMDLNRHPGLSYIDRLKTILGRFQTYFTTVRPVPFLDDTTTKNVLVDGGRLSGIVDVDQLCFGDPLLTVGLTQMALRAADHDVDYVEHWIRLLNLNQEKRQVVQAYTLLFCVDFMSELGQRFNQEDQPQIDPGKFSRLKLLFETLAESAAER